MLAIRIALIIFELAPGLRQVIEMTNHNLGSKLTELIGDWTMCRRPNWPPRLSSPRRWRPRTPTPLRSAAGWCELDRGIGLGRRLLAVVGDTRRSGIDAVLPVGDGDIVLGTELAGSVKNTARTSGFVGAVTRVF